MKQAGSRSRTLDLLARSPARYRLWRKINARAAESDILAYKPRVVTMFCQIQFVRGGVVETLCHYNTLLMLPDLTCQYGTHLWVSLANTKSCCCCWENQPMCRLQFWANAAFFTKGLMSRPVCHTTKITCLKTWKAVGRRQDQVKSNQIYIYSPSYICWYLKVLYRNPA